MDAYCWPGETEPRVFVGKSYGQFLSADGFGSIRVSGLNSPDAALWLAARLLVTGWSASPKRGLRKALSRQQRERLIAIARRKLTGAR